MRFPFALFSNDIDHAADRRITVKHTARTSYNFNSGNLAQWNLQPINRGHVRAIKPSAVEHDQSLAEGIVTPEAAHINKRQGGIAAVVPEIDALQFSMPAQGFSGSMISSDQPPSSRALS